MTAHAFLTAKRHLIVASDGAICNLSGEILAIRSKVALVPEWSAVIAFRGYEVIAESLLYVTRHVGTFDEFVDEVGPALRTVIDHAQDSSDDMSDAHGSVLFGGWSESRQIFESYRVGSREREVLDGDASSFTEPFTVSSLREAYAAPGPRQDLYAQFGIGAPCDTVEEEKKYAARIICAARAGQSPDDPYAIGGFVQVTFATRDAIETRIVHRWPDLIGERVDPSRGEAMPKSLAPNASRLRRDIDERKRRKERR